MSWPHHADGLPQSEYVHGQHYPDKGGYFDASRQAFVANMPKTLVSAAPRSRTLNEIGWRDGPIPNEERIAKSQAAGWKPSPHHEQLRRLRDSNRAEDRDTYNRMGASERVSVGYYEAGLRAHVTAGRDLPDDVAPPRD